MPARHFAHASVAAFCLLAAALPAQVREVTGAPQARFADPFTRVTVVRELDGDSLAVLVLDQGERRIDRVDLRRGTRVQVGRNGSGPREYNAPGRLFAGPNGTTLFADRGGTRALRIERDGTTLVDVPLPPTALGPGPGLLGVDAAGGLVFRAIAADGLGGDSAAVIRFDPVGSSVRVLTHISSGITITSSGNGNVTMGRPGFQPFSQVPVFGVLPSGELIEVTPEPYRTNRLVNGRWISGPLIPHTPVPVTAADRETERAARQRAQPSGFGAPPPGGRPPEDLSDAVFPRVKPPYAGASPMTIAPNGDLWIARSQAYGETAITYDLVLPNGTRKNEVRLPPGRRLVGFGRNALYLVRQDPETDLQYLERWKNLL